MPGVHSLWSAFEPPPYGLEILAGAVILAAFALWRSIRRPASSRRPGLGLDVRD